ncbi:MAG: tail fiber domain-containing protein [Crocinitomicaceae bacterium]|nr:tail fiber domain-containing protein [Crocinitomicaceae bacterium]
MNNHANPTGVIGIASGSGNNLGGYTGTYTHAGATNTTFNYGIHSTANGDGIIRAGYFDGWIETTAGSVITSDQQFKVDVTPITSALSTVSKLMPKTYFMDTVNYSQFSFGKERQYGFIAQEVETILPELVHESIHPGKRDSLGNLEGEATNYKTLNYTGLIPINTKAIIELNQKIDKATLSDVSLKTNINDLSNSLEKVLEMRGVSYKWNQLISPQLELDSAEHIGFIAQEIANVDTRLVFKDNENNFHVDYDKIIPILTEAIQELNTKVDDKDNLIDSLKNQINNLNDRLTQLENCLSGILPFLCQ